MWQSTIQRIEYCELRKPMSTSTMQGVEILGTRHETNCRELKNFIP